MWDFFCNFALAFEMKRFWYILLILVSIGVQWFEPMDKPTMQTVQTSGCAVQQTDHHTLVGIQGEPLTLANSGSNITTSVPTHFSANTERTPFGKNRTRTAFLRKMIHHYQPVFIVFAVRNGLRQVLSVRLPGARTMYTSSGAFCVDFQRKN